jgi:hypothetical protein
MAASPHNPDPRGPQPVRDSDREPLRDTRDVDREVGGGMRYGWTWIWVWLLILAFIVAIVWFGGWGWAGYGGWWWGNRNAQITQPAAVTMMSGSGVAVLNATNKQPFVGRSFNAQNVPVQAVVNDHTLWVGANGAPPMLVVLTGNNNTAANANISEGSRININGTVEKSPSAAQAKQQWSLSDDDANSLEQQGAYIQATEVTSEVTSQQP